MIVNQIKIVGDDNPYKNWHQEGGILVHISGAKYMRDPYDNDVGYFLYREDIGSHIIGFDHSDYNPILVANWMLARADSDEKYRNKLLKKYNKNARLA